jgi:hypothetical protein
MSLPDPRPDAAPEPARPRPRPLLRVVTDDPDCTECGAPLGTPVSPYTAVCADCHAAAAIHDLF